MIPIVIEESGREKGPLTFIPGRASESLVKLLPVTPPTGSWRRCCSSKPRTLRKISTSISTRPAGRFDGLGIFDICSTSNLMCIRCVSAAASMGAFLLCAGTKGKRSSLQHSRT